MSAIKKAMPTYTVDRPKELYVWNIAMHANIKRLNKVTCIAIILGKKKRLPIKVALSGT